MDTKTPWGVEEKLNLRALVQFSHSIQVQRGISSSTRLVHLLSPQTRSHWMGPELAEALEVHPRTLRRDVDRRAPRLSCRPAVAAGDYAFRAGQALPRCCSTTKKPWLRRLRCAPPPRAVAALKSRLRALVKLEQAMPLRRQQVCLRPTICPWTWAGGRPRCWPRWHRPAATSCGSATRTKTQGALPSVLGLVIGAHRMRCYLWRGTTRATGAPLCDRMVAKPEAARILRCRADDSDIKAWHFRSIAAPPPDRRGGAAYPISEMAGAFRSRRCGHNAGRWAQCQLMRRQRCTVSGSWRWILEFEVLAPASLQSSCAWRRALRLHWRAQFVSWRRAEPVPIPASVRKCRAWRRCSTLSAQVITCVRT